MCIACARTPTDHHGVSCGELWRRQLISIRPFGVQNSVLIICASCPIVCARFTLTLLRRHKRQATAMDQQLVLTNPNQRSILCTSFVQLFTLGFKFMHTLFVFGPTIGKLYRLNFNSKTRFSVKCNTNDLCMSLSSVIQGFSKSVTALLPFYFEFLTQKYYSYIGLASFRTKLCCKFHFLYPF